MGLLYINITLITSPWTSKSINIRWDQQGCTWLTHYPTECSISLWVIHQDLEPAVEGVGNPSFSIIQHCFNGQPGPEGSQVTSAAEKDGERQSQKWRPRSSMWIITTCPRPASNWVPNELELFTLYQNNLWWQLCLMTNFLCHFTLCLPWFSVRFQALEEKYVY